MTTDLAEWSTSPWCAEDDVREGSLAFVLDVVGTTDGGLAATENTLFDGEMWYFGTLDASSWSASTTQIETWAEGTETTTASVSLDENGDTATGFATSTTILRDLEGVELESCVREVPLEARRATVGRALAPPNGSAPDGTWIVKFDLAWTATGTTCSSPASDFAGEAGWWLDLATEGDRALASLPGIALTGTSTGDAIDVTEHIDVVGDAGEGTHYTRDTRLRVDFAGEVPSGTYTLAEFGKDGWSDEPYLDCSKTWDVRLLPVARR